MLSHSTYRRYFYARNRCVYGSEGRLDLKIAVGFDHGGIALRDVVIQSLTELGHEIVDFGTAGSQSVDYPEYAARVAHAVASGQCDRGVLACGTGIGMSIAANKVPGCYAALLADCFSARMAAEHNAANVVCLGGRVTGPELASEMLAVYLQSQPDNSGRHQLRREIIYRMEKNCFSGAEPGTSLPTDA